MTRTSPTPVSYPFPDPISETERHEMLLGGENRLLSDAHELSEAATTPGAKRHLLGLIRRHLMLQRCRMWLRERCLEESGSGPLSPYEITDLNIHINAFYVALCGALDNLAWALTYEHHLKDPVDELHRPTQHFVACDGKAFLASLGRSAASIALRLEAARDWFTELRTFRDPAAHRLPLSVVGGVLDEKNLSEHQRLGKESSKAFKTGDHLKGMELFYQQSRVGAFRPWLEHPNGPVADPAFFLLPNLLARDHAFYIDTVGTVALIMLKRLGVKPVMDHWIKAGHGRSTWEVGSYLKRFEPYRPPFPKRG